ncbi:DNA topoisomerase (ATP-hydrolyzing) [Gloeothece citriformis PCC 7424]|uniref:DNA topoisomerase (ATP-hydrolyzing) n=1 Tax=Gloeothece citriformis (strain PCC 7424) TaxID=65393 RepID=B7KIH9_GLOC7|nr:DNA topoisomerase (ATP-hydrolyzing) [Gloeothece citriformis]ACK69385.1 DNA topoisomerase (ATP-hydrolyzing) [Gloeothece citriformis PCC 7424]
MARQLDLLATGQIIPTALHQEMERSYLEYAMSVIVGRALPDVRDGMKPVHRRIVYAMHELGLTADRPYRKCARVVGDVLGKYHPHGDQAVYDALVRMVQEFSSRYPLLAGHGNFGSVDNDPPAAMRYTETRLAPIGQEAVLGNISEAIVDFTNNFDNSQQEPVVLPAQLPILLLNGCSGIAVGMATNIPPHNLGEIVDGLIALIDRPQLKDEQLWEIIPGPDFPTGGKIIDTEGIKEAYRTGKGIIPVQGVTHVETISLEGRRPKERTAIVVTELPYQVNKSGWIEKVADLVNQGRLEGIADIRDESDRQGMRVVIELKREFKTKKVLEDLYKQTALQSNFGVILLALVDNKPCQLSLRELLEEFLNFREQTLTRQYRHELTQAQTRLHLLEGLLIALRNLDQVINILRNAPDGTTAKQKFQEELTISEEQADSILAMPMRRLTGLEQQKLQTEYEDLQQRINQLQVLLNDRIELMKSLKKDLRALKRKFGDERRTRIVSSAPTASKSEEKKGNPSTPPQPSKTTTPSKSSEPKAKDSSSLSLFTPQPPPKDAVLTITEQGYIYWQSAAEFNSISSIKKGTDFPIYTQRIQQQDSLIVITDQGKAYPVSGSEIPPQESQPCSLLNLLPNSVQKNSQKIASYFLFPQQKNLSELILLTGQGRIKRLSMSELEQIGNRGLSLIKLKDDDRLGYLSLTSESHEVAIATNGGRVLRLTTRDEQIPLMGRNAQGNQALRLRYGENIVGCVTPKIDDNLLLITQSGYGKRIPVNSLRITKLGEIGTMALQFSSKTDNLAGMILAKPKKEVILVTNQERRLIIPIDSVGIWGKDGVGDQVVKLKPQESILLVVAL